MPETAETLVERLSVERRFLETANWQRFHLFLTSLDAEEPIPQPLILAANYASPASKLARLGEQLRWAERNGVFAQAAGYLDCLPGEQWSHCGEERWARESELW